MVKIQNKEIPQLRFRTITNQERICYLDAKSNREILKLAEKSIILPYKIEKLSNGLVILKEYKVMKAIPREIKKAV